MRWESPVLLLEFPQLGVDVEGPPKVRLPLFVSILRKISAAGRKRRHGQTEPMLTSRFPQLLALLRTTGFILTSMSLFLRLQGGTKNLFSFEEVDFLSEKI